MLCSMRAKVARLRARCRSLNGFFNGLGFEQRPFGARQARARLHDGSAQLHHRRNWLLTMMFRRVAIFARSASISTGSSSSSGSTACGAAFSFAVMPFPDMQISDANDGLNSGCAESPPATRASATAPIFCGAGAPSSSPPSRGQAADPRNMRESYFRISGKPDMRGVERRKAQPQSPALRRGAPLREARRLPALHCGDFSPRGCASGRGRGPPGPPIRQAFARLRPRRVQPSKAAPRSGDGQRPEASRVRGYEPRPQAPPLPHVQRASAERPSLGEGGWNIRLG